MVFEFQSPIFKLFVKFVKAQLYRNQKKILQELSWVKNLSLVSYGAWNIFPLNLLLPRGLILSMDYELTFRFVRWTGTLCSTLHVP